MSQYEFVYIPVKGSEHNSSHITHLFSKLRLRLRKPSHNSVLIVINCNILLKFSPFAFLPLIEFLQNHTKALPRGGYRQKLRPDFIGNIRIGLEEVGCRITESSLPSMDGVVG